MTDDSPSNAEIGRTMGRIEGDLREVRQGMGGLAQTYVTRVEHAAHKEATDREIKILRESIDRGFAEVKAEISGSRPAWWVLLSPGIAAVSLVIALVMATR